MRLSKRYYLLYGTYWILFWLFPIPIFSLFTNDAGILFAYYEKFALPSVVAVIVLGLLFPRRELFKDRLKVTLIGVVIPAFIVIFFLSRQIKLGIGGF